MPPGLFSRDRAPGTLSRAVRRRRFLAGVLGAAAAAGVGGLALLQPRRTTFSATHGRSRRERLAGSRRVVVIGGGLAGITAALDLAGQGFAVTLLERGSELGGKLTGWAIDALGERFPLEHGFHGFFSQYYTLASVLADAGADQALVPVSGYPVWIAGRPEERFGDTTSLFPVNLLAVIARSPGLRFVDFLREGPGTLELMRYDPLRTFAQWDSIDFLAFCREQGVNRQLVETVLAPFGKTTLNRLERLSAAEAIRFFHFYFLGNPEGLGFRVLARDVQTAVLGPLRRRLETLGVQIETGRSVNRLLRAGERVHGVVVEDGDAGTVVRIARADVPEHGWLAVPRPGGAPLFMRWRDGRAVAYDGRCTHQGCPVVADPSSGGFRCPCHAGTFDEDGQPTSGPPRRPLRSLAVAMDGHDVVVRERPGASARILPCDYCVVACDVRGLQQLVAASQLGAPALERAVAGLGTADPYVVMRLWLDRPVRDDRDPFVTISGHGLVDSLAIYSRFQEPYVAWARRRRGSVVELHAYAIPPERRAPAAVLRSRLLDELRALLPELRQAQVLHEVFMEHDDFTRWAPGDHQGRPGTLTEIPNLVLAGDHVRIGAPVALMEAAVASGRLAANAIRRLEGLGEVPLTTVAARGPLASWW